jgi:hypothetical protein
MSEQVGVKRDPHGSGQAHMSMDCGSCNATAAPLGGLSSLEATHRDFTDPAA